MDSGGDGLKERLDAEDIDHPLHIVGEHLQAHFRFDLFKGLGQEVATAHPRLQGSEGMFDGLPADLHDVWHPIEPSLHRCDHTQYSIEGSAGRCITGGLWDEVF